MLGKIYDIEISLDSIGGHDWAKATIKEIYIPGIKLYVNAHAMFYEEADTPIRVPENWESVEVDDTLIFTLNHILKSKMLIHEELTHELKLGE